jgi:hypothetical protein
VLGNFPHQPVLLNHRQWVDVAYDVGMTIGILKNA